MKYLSLIFSLFPLYAYSQTDVDSQIKMTTAFGASNVELQDILAFQNIDYFTVLFTGKDLREKYFSLIVKELWDGTITEIDTLIKTARLREMMQGASDSLKFNVTAQKLNNDQLKVFFNFPQLRNMRLYEATNSYDYSLRAIGTKMDIEIGKEFPAFAYILPFEKDGWKMYCAVDRSGKDIDSWGSEFGIVHYLVFEMKFE